MKGKKTFQIDHILGIYRPSYKPNQKHRLLSKHNTVKDQV